MDDDWTILCLRVLVHHLSHPPPELQQSVAEGVAVAGPLCVVELNHLPLFSILSQTNSSEVQHIIESIVKVLCAPLSKLYSFVCKSLTSQNYFTGKYLNLT